MDRKLAAILAADVVGYSKHMERDEQGTYQRLVAERKELFEPEIARHHGRIFKLMGDGLLAEFASVVDAVECAVALQRGLAERNRDLSEEHRIHVRIGINLGEVIVEGEDRFGEGVNIATRLEQLAEPDAIYVSGKVAKEVEKKLAFGFEALGEQRVKNIDEPVPVYRVALAGNPKSYLRRRGTRKKAILAVAAAAALASVIIGGWLAPGYLGGLFASPAEASAPRLAVLAFDNMSGDPALDYFSDGVSEDIISMLAQSPDLSVIARNSSFVYKGQATDVRKIGNDLNVDYVLEGSVRKDADQVRIVAQLVNARTGEHVWANRFDESGKQPLQIQDAVTNRIVVAIAGDRGEIKRSAHRAAWGKDTTSLEEYDIYLRGHQRLAEYTASGTAEAMEIWSEGLKRFPTSPLLKLKLGFAHYLKAVLGWADDPAVEFRRMGELARAATAQGNLDPLEIKLAHWLMVYVRLSERNFQAALNEAETVLSLFPSDAFMAAALFEPVAAMEKFDKALSLIEQGIQNDPANKVLYSWWKGFVLCTAGRYQESNEALTQVDDWSDAIPLIRAINYVNLGQLDEARAQVDKALVLNPIASARLWHDTTFLPESLLERQATDLLKAGLPAG